MISQTSNLQLRLVWVYMQREWGGVYCTYMYQVPLEWNVVESLVEPFSGLYGKNK